MDQKAQFYVYFKAAEKDIIKFCFLYPQWVFEEYNCL